MLLSFTFCERYGRLFYVQRVKNPFIPNFGFGDETDFTPNELRRVRHIPPNQVTLTLSLQG